MLNIVPRIFLGSHFSEGFFFLFTSFSTSPVNRSSFVFSCFAESIHTTYSFLFENDSEW